MWFWNKNESSENSDTSSNLMKKDFTWFYQRARKILKLRFGIWNKHFDTSVKVHSLIQALALGRKKLLDSSKEQETYWSGDPKSGKRNVEQAFLNKHESAFSDTISRLMKKDFAWFSQKRPRSVLFSWDPTSGKEINRITWGDLCVFKELWTSRVDCDDNCASGYCCCNSSLLAPKIFTQ